LHLSTFFLNAPPPPEISTLSLHDALPISQPFGGQGEIALEPPDFELRVAQTPLLLGAARFRGMSRLNPRLSLALGVRQPRASERDRKSTRLNSSHVAISYAVFCLKKKKKK